MGRAKTIGACILGSWAVEKLKLCLYLCLRLSLKMNPAGRGSQPMPTIGGLEHFYYMFYDFPFSWEFQSIPID